MIILILLQVLSAPVQWQVRPYGPDVWAVSKVYGEGSHWSRAPGDARPEQQEIIACKDIPSRAMADAIAGALNRMEKRE